MVRAPRPFRTIYRQNLAVHQGGGVTRYRLIVHEEELRIRIGSISVPYKLNPLST
jgi:hypothetical protein